MKKLKLLFILIDFIALASFCSVHIQNKIILLIMLVFMQLQILSFLIIADKKVEVN